MSNKRTAEQPLRPVYEPPAELVAWCRHETRRAINAHSPPDLHVWRRSPAIFHYVRRNGTPFAYQVLSQGLFRELYEGNASSREVGWLMRQRAVVPTLSTLTALFYYGHAATSDLGHDDADGEDLDDGPETQDQQNQSLRAHIRRVIPVAAEFVEEKADLPYDGVAHGELCVQGPLFAFVRSGFQILCDPSEPDPDAEALRPMFWAVLETLMNRGFDLEEADINGDTPRSFLEQWDDTQAARLFDPVILK